MKNQIRLGSLGYKNLSREWRRQPACMRSSEIFEKFSPMQKGNFCIMSFSSGNTAIYIITIFFSFSIIVMSMCVRDKVVTGMVCVPNNCLEGLASSLSRRVSISFLSLSGGSVSTSKPIIRKVLL